METICSRSYITEGTREIGGLVEGVWGVQDFFFLLFIFIDF